MHRAVLSVMMLGGLMAAHADDLVVGRSGQGDPVVLVGPADPGPGARRALESWQGFLRERGIAVTASRAGEVPSGRGALVAFEVLGATSLADQAGVDLASLGDARPEAHVIVAQTWRDRPLVLVVGATDQGVDAGAAQLLSLMGFWDGALTIAPAHLVRTPFIRGREATLTPTGRSLKERPELMRKVNYEHWSKEQLFDLTRYVRACGFNSLQVMELLSYAGGGGSTRDVVAPVLYTLSDAARANGLRVTLYLFGSADGFRWDDPKTRPQREERYREMAKTYGAHVDHITTHWIDDGYEGGYVTPQEGTTFLWNEFRKYNPDVVATCDTWGNDARSNAIEPGGGFWDGKDRPGFLDETYSPKAVGIALERWYDPGKAALVKQAGRRLGIWGWYLGDYEMAFASHLEGRILGKYFAALPDEARDQVDWLSIERCFHALPADVNWYVAGQLMWDPRRPVPDILLDYCRAVYGPSNAEAMREVYQVVEEGEKDYKYYGYFIPESDRFPDVHATPEYQARAKAALEKLNGVRLPDTWSPNFPTLAPPQDYLLSLRTSLEALAEGRYPEF